MAGLGPGPLDPGVLSREIERARAGGELSWERGWWTFYDDEHVWRYQDTGELVGFVERAGLYGPFRDHNRPCAACHEFGLPLVPPAAYEWAADPCLGTIPGIISACCGHGHGRGAQAYGYGGLFLEGEEALEWLRAAVLGRDGREHVGRPDGPTR